MVSVVKRSTHTFRKFYKLKIEKFYILFLIIEGKGYRWVGAQAAIPFYGVAVVPQSNMVRTNLIYFGKRCDGSHGQVED